MVHVIKAGRLLPYIHEKREREKERKREREKERKREREKEIEEVVPNMLKNVTL
jgi:hypothetical protein